MEIIVSHVKISFYVCFNSSFFSFQESNQNASISNKGRKKKNKNKGVSTYRFVTSITETPASPIFSVAFNHLIKNRKIFSTVSKNKISIYECLEENSIKLLRVYMEPDHDEVFNTVTWGYDGKNGPVLAAGGVKGVVRLIYCNIGPSNCYKSLIGHSKNLI
jgi:polycomb protein EED